MRAWTPAGDSLAHLIRPQQERLGDQQVEMSDACHHTLPPNQARAASILARPLRRVHRQGEPAKLEQAGPRRHKERHKVLKLRPYVA